MELDCLRPKNLQTEIPSCISRYIRQSAQELSDRSLSAVLNGLAGIAEHRLHFVSRHCGNARAGDNDLFESSLLLRRLLAWVFYGSRARSLSLIRLSQLKRVSRLGIRIPAHATRRRRHLA